MCKRRAAARSAGLAACGSYPKKNRIRNFMASMREQQKPGVNSRWRRSEESFLSGFSDGKNKKNTFFQKRTGEVTENKGRGYMNSRKRTGNRSGEVVENT